MFTCPAEMGMTSHTADTEEHATMLDTGIGIKQSRTHGTNARPHGLHHQLLQPAGINHLDVVIEQTDQLTCGLLNSPVVQS